MAKIAMRSSGRGRRSPRRRAGTRRAARRAATAPRNACSIEICWSSSMPSSSASGSRSSSASASASWLRESGTWEIMPEHGCARLRPCSLTSHPPSPTTAHRVPARRLHPGRVRALLGAAAHAALGRGEPEPAHRAAADGDELGVLVRMLLLGATEPDAAVAAALAPAPHRRGRSRLITRDGSGWRAALDVRPYAEEDGPPWWVVSDLDARRQDRDHVTGVAPPRSLSRRRPSAARSGPCSTSAPVSGAGPARHPARPDGHRHGRGRAGAGHRSGHVALSDVNVELREGPWLAPVAGGTFDRIVSNPPFVPGRPGSTSSTATPEPPATTRWPRCWPTCRGTSLPAGGAVAGLVAARAGQGLARPGPLLAAARRRRVDPAARGGRPGAARRHLAARLRAGPRGARHRAQAGAWLDWLDSAGSRRSASG